MAGHDDAATPAAQKLCNQRAPAGVEVVGGLVEQQDIGRFLEHAGKGQTCALPAAERAERVRGGDPGQPGAGQRVRQPVLQRPVRRARVLGAAFAAQQAADAGKASGNPQCLRYAAARLPDLQPDLLPHPADGSGTRDGACARLDRACQQPQERGFATTVAPGKAGPPPKFRVISENNTNAR